MNRIKLPLVIATILSAATGACSPAQDAAQAPSIAVHGKSAHPFTVEFTDEVSNTEFAVLSVFSEDLVRAIRECDRAWIHSALNDNALYSRDFDTTWREVVDPFVCSNTNALPSVAHSRSVRRILVDSRDPRVSFSRIRVQGQDLVVIVIRDASVPTFKQMLDEGTLRRRWMVDFAATLVRVESNGKVVHPHTFFYTETDAIP